MTWASSNRRQRLPQHWEEIRARVKRRANGMCEAENHAPACDGRGTDADHITAGDNHSLDNLQWLSAPCHRAKTAKESVDRNRARVTARLRPQENHPGRNIS